MTFFKNVFCLSALCLFLIFQHGHAQTYFQAELSAGYGFNVQSISLGNEDIRNSKAILFTGGASLGLPLGKDFVFETGIFAHYINTRGAIGITNYNSRSLKFYVPFSLGYNFNDNSMLGFGVVVKNNKDLSLFHIAGSYNLRYDLLLRYSYKLSDHWGFTASACYNTGIPDAFLIHAPQLSLKGGLSYRFSKR